MRQNGKQALVVDSSGDARLLRALASEVRGRILELLRNRELNLRKRDWWKAIPPTGSKAGRRSVPPGISGIQIPQQHPVRQQEKTA
jgi:hypothetical protein